MPEKAEEPQSAQSVADFALSLTDRKIKAFNVQKEACQDKAVGLGLQRKAWDLLLEWVSSLALARSQWPTLQMLHSGLTLGVDADQKFNSGVAMKLDAELEEFIVVQEGIRGQVEQMRKQQESERSGILRPERKGDAIDHERSRRLTADQRGN